MSVPNELFRRARERLPSRRTPGASLSRQELAELVNQWIFVRHAKVVELDDNYIGKLERGVIRWPGRRYRDAFRAILRVETDAQLGLYGQRRRPVNVADVDRQQFLRTAGTLASLPWLELFAAVEPTPLPPRVTPVEIGQIRAAATIFSSWDYERGGGLAREAVFAQLRWAAGLLDADCEEVFKPQLFTAVSLLAETAGFMAFDAGAHDDAQRAFRFALGCAEQAPNWQMRASVLADMARQAVWLNDPDRALTYVELALVRTDRLTATENAMLHTVRARALARVRRIQDALAAVGAADAAFAHAEPSNDPSWMAYYDHAQHHGDTGHALFDLAMYGHQTEAAQRLAYSVAHHTDPYARSRAISRTKLASLLMAADDPRYAAEVGHEALDEAGGLRSRRAVDNLRELYQSARRHPHIPEAAELCDRIAQSLDAR